MSGGCLLRRPLLLRGLVSSPGRARTAPARCMASSSRPAPPDPEAPCVVYGLKGQLYVQLTNRSNATTLVASRGPGFVMPSSSGFRPLPSGFEPAAGQVLDALSERMAGGGVEGSAGGGSVVFAGAGEPTLRLGVMLEVAGALAAAGAEEGGGSTPELSLNTNGLAALAHGRCVVPELAVGRIRRVTVNLNTADPEQYGALMGEGHGPASHRAACDFVARCVEAGLEATCTAVEAPGVDVAAVEALAGQLGAGFRSRTYHP
mmetsp:Transcript_13642/g.43008  ORF Transcript_13642/g.43008 Transcript_13642/m.43008 type:complete len:261 (+) Transcript_13642:57-839(+)